MTLRVNYRLKAHVDVKRDIYLCFLSLLATLDTFKWDRTFRDEDGTG